MSDNELLKLTYEKYGFRMHSMSAAILYHGDYGYSIRLDQWNPLKDGQQALDLMERFGLSAHKNGPVWCVNDKPNFTDNTGKSNDLKRAIVQCIAKVQLSECAARG